jgi:hypothetical protein
MAASVIWAPDLTRPTHQLSRQGRVGGGVGPVGEADVKALQHRDFAHHLAEVRHAS